jgi:hypothetical protein
MSKWFKILSGFAVAALLTAVFTGAVFAQGPVGDADGDGVRDLDGSGLGAGRGPAYGYVDENNDGINDRYADGTAFVDEDGDGACDVCGATTGTGYGNGFGFVDEDGDGINDRYADGTAFVDEDGDGICDLNETAPGTGTMQRLNQAFRTDNALQRSPGTPRGAYGRWAAGQ